MQIQEQIITFSNYCKLIRKHVNSSDDVKWVRDNLFFGLLILLAISGVTALYNRALDWYALISAFWVFGTGFLLAAAVIYIRAPWKLNQNQQKVINSLHDQIGLLEAYRNTVEDREVRLQVLRCDREIVSFGTMVKVSEMGPAVTNPIEQAESARVVFTNNRKVGVPGKTAKSVIAKVSYDDPNGRSFTLDGRWADTDQTATLSPLQSKNHLLRVDFEPGADHHLDIAIRFQDGCYAVNNDPLLTSNGAKRGDRKLVGIAISIRVQLLAEHVNQVFRFELSNPANGQIGIVPL